MSKLFIISGPSGAGEDSIINGVKKKFPIEMIITTSTREIREGESQGNPYYFISKEEFKNGIKNNKFFEWAEQDRGNYYGVTHDEIERIKKIKGFGLWKVDYKGVITLKKISPKIPAILINAPIEQLENRLRKRDASSDEFIKERLKYAKGWRENRDLFDFEVMNEDGKLEESIEKVAKIIKEYNI